MLIPLVGLVLGVFLAGQFYTSLAERLSFIGSANLARIVAFIIILVVVFAAVYILGSILRGMFRVSFLGWADRLGGVVFGLGIGWIICSVIVVLLARYVALPAELPQMSGSALEGWLENWQGLVAIRQSVNKTINESKLATFQLNSFPFILSLLPEEFDAVRKFFGG
jgi:membrane protein required for colicin V production